VLLDQHQSAYSDAGLNATMRDLGRFAQMMLQNRVGKGTGADLARKLNLRFKRGEMQE